MCLSQLDHPLDQEAHPDLCSVSQWVIRWLMHTQVPTLSTVDVRNIHMGEWHQENDVLQLLLCIPSVTLT